MNHTVLDFEMILKHFPKKEDITIYPISDVHLGAAEQLEKEWMDFLTMVKNTPNVYLTLGGDLLNNGVKSSVTNVYRERYMPRESKKLMTQLLEPVKDRILCAVCGNHERRSMREVDDDPVLDIMENLGIGNLYREDIAFLKIQIGDTHNNGLLNPTYMVVVTHGAGGGIYTGGAVNRNERFGYVIDGADLLVVGHTHKPFTTQPGKIKIDPYNNKISIKPFKVVSTTSWLEYAGYPVQKMLLPTTHCLHKIVLCGSRKEISVTM